MAYGDGSITERKRPDGASYSPKRWRVMVDAGNDPITGKRRRASRVVSGTKRDAMRERDRIKRELESGLSVDGSRVTFGEFAAEWAARREASGELALRTTKEYANVVRYLSRFIGGMRIRDIDARAVESLYTAIREEKAAKNGRPIGGTTMNKIHRVLSMVMKQAELYDLITRNPCSRIKAPRLDAVNRCSLSMGDSMRLMSVIESQATARFVSFRDKERRRRERGRDVQPRSCVRGVKDMSGLVAVRLALATGMRIGEICGLCWDAVDLSAPSVDVVRSRTNYGTTKAPKSRAGMRTIAVDESTAAHLARWRHVQRAAMEGFGAQWGEHVPVCCSDVFGFLDLPNLEAWWRKWRDENGFPGLKFHELRHTQATQLLANGVDVKTVQSRLGHASASLTLNQYAHAVPENDRAAADLIGELFAPKKPETPPDNRGFTVLKSA